MIALPLFLFLLAASAAPPGAFAGALTLSRWTVDGGGSGFVASGPFILGGTIGQPDAGTVARLAYSLTGGFWGPGSAVIVGVGDEPPVTPPELPRVARVLPPAPNPLQLRTRLALELPRELAVTVEVFDLSGARLKILHSGRMPAGRHALEWDARDSSGRRVSAGLYFVRARLGALERSQKLIVLH
ncbi:MAG: hypothetical protein HZB25_02990 [Candidatus Eisenbacteria bacterium]|nr:hypothetical protein [Candidatus Eisenbacteria bacterium]